MEGELRVQKAKPLVVSVMGQTGVGKSALINSLLNTDLEVDAVHPRTKYIEQWTVSRADKHTIVIYDLPGIGESERADASYLEEYRKHLFASDIVLWAIHIDNYFAPFDRQSLHHLFNGMEPSLGDELINKITFVLTKADLLTPLPWTMAYMGGDYVNFLPSSVTEHLLEQKALYVQSQFIQPFGDRIVSHTHHNGDFALNDPQFSYDKHSVKYQGLLTRGLVDKFSKDHPKHKKIFERLYSNCLPVPCSAYFRYNLDKLILIILDKLESRSKVNFEPVINSGLLNRVPLQQAQRMCNLVIFDVENNRKVFDLADVDLLSEKRTGRFIQMPPRDIRGKDTVEDERKQQEDITDNQLDNSKNNTLISGPVQGLIIGAHNTVTLVFQGEKRQTAPFLAPPHPLYSLIGRSELIHHLKQQLFRSQNLALSALNGLPGVGKTALALAVAHDSEVLGYFCDGVLWAGLGRESNVFWHLKTWGIALGVSPSEMNKLTNINTLAQTVHRAIGTRRMLLVIDDAWSVDAALAFKLGGPYCAHLITTRFPEVAERFAGDRTVLVKELHEDAGLALLEQLAPGLIKMVPDQAQELVRVVGGLPLPLILMGNYLRIQMHTGQPRRVHSALDRLQRVKERLQLSQPQSGLEHHPSLADGVPLSLLEIIKISDEALTEEARQALRALFVFPSKPNTFSEEAALAVSDTTTKAIDTLMDFGLLESSGPSRFMLHQTIRDYAATESTDTAVYKRMIEFFIQYVEDHKIDKGLFEQETENILAAVEVMLEREMHPAGASAFVHFIRILRKSRDL